MFQLPLCLGRDLLMTVVCGACQTMQVRNNFCINCGSSLRSLETYEEDFDQDELEASYVEDPIIPTLEPWRVALWASISTISEPDRIQHSEGAVVHSIHDPDRPHRRFTINEVALLNAAINSREVALNDKFQASSSAHHALIEELSDPTKRRNRIDAGSIADEEYTRLLGSMSDSTMRLQMLEVARKKLAQGTLGRCELCYADIQLGRLELLPEMDVCMSCTDKTVVSVLPASETQLDSSTGETVPSISPLDELNSMIGLFDVKNEVTSLRAVLEVNGRRRDAGLRTRSVLPHIVFTGSPGTGKTTVARLLGRMFLDMGLLESGHVVEVDRSRLVASYVGQTAPTTLAACEEALGGILFIDEAYSLAAYDGEWDFGQEAIDTLLKYMEDHRGEFVVVVAGYEEEMARFIGSNPGLQSRFDTFLSFADYTPSEMLQIFEELCRTGDYVLARGCDTILLERFEISRSLPGFANGRTVRKVFEEAIKRQSGRLSKVACSSDDLQLLVASDLALL